MNQTFDVLLLRLLKFLQLYSMPNDLRKLISTAPLALIKLTITNISENVKLHLIVVWPFSAPNAFTNFNKMLAIKWCNERNQN